jgi:MoaA/NifB/PqqE/SkfB family radical SAM enzyme
VTPRLVEELNEAGLTDLQVSVDGARPTPTTIKVLDNLRSRLEVLGRVGRFRTVVNAVVGSAPRSSAWSSTR